jgi:hypothetical protein
MPALPPAVPNTLLRYTAEGELETVSLSQILDTIGSPTAPTSPAVGDKWWDTSALYSNVLANPGFETAGGGGATSADSWNLSGSNGTATRVGADGGVTPYAGAWMLKLVAAGLDPVSSANAYQVVTGDMYRSAAGVLSFRTWLAEVASIGPADANREVYVTALAYASDGTTVLGRIDTRIAGNFDTSLGGQARSSDQRVTLTAGSWEAGSIDVRTSLDAALGGALSAVATVRLYVRAGGKSGGAFTLYVDSVWF